MKYKLIAIDMDGTLLNSKNQISPRDKEAIRRAGEKGLRIVLATGRILKSAKYYSEQLGLKSPIIASNGGIVIDEEGKILAQKPLDKESIIKLIELAEEEDLYFHLYNEEKFYAQDKVKEVLEFYNEGNEDLTIELELFDDIVEKLASRDFNMYKIIFIDEDIEKLKSFRKLISDLDDINISSSWTNNIEANAKDVSKGGAIEELCKIFHIKPEEVLAIGDSENDLSMFKLAGLSVAMGNASDFVKSQADYTTDTNDKDGLAKAIEKFILGNEENKDES